ncbi:hypothetical protein HELRODRAFT_176086 [Helobdella robusta]|uniref:Uncharacterized protein n=1 Tax=Helobdella robusta TaxID=6412 RepID=T1FA45_HELRO|nr:hypothetical protein HELRODRAFT_176086 [Helobdella robusta]ESO00237.1 hypothetical protein HELRODRAFT_176086 [Helobdella robusta]
MSVKYDKLKSPCLYFKTTLTNKFEDYASQKFGPFLRGTLKLKLVLDKGITLLNQLTPPVHMHIIMQAFNFSSSSNDMDDMLYDLSVGGDAICKDTYHIKYFCLLTGQKRCLKFFGHIAHANPMEDHYRALKAVIDRPSPDWTRPHGRPRQSWIPQWRRICPSSTTVLTWLAHDRLMEAPCKHGNVPLL